jgi:cyclopentanol dehydrogenase
MTRLAGRRAVVTGAGSGIGRAIARRLVEEGATVLAADVDLAGVEETARPCGTACRAMRADVTKEDDARAIVNEGDGLDILVNCAGIAVMGGLEQLTDADLHRVIAVNLEGVVRTTRAAVQRLKASKHGRVINIGSVEGLRGSGLLPAYAATKGGVIALTRANAVELGRFGITVNVICPGPIVTPMLEPLVADEMQKKKIVGATLLKRLGRPEEIAGAAAFLASDDASFVTGHTLVVDGGMTVHT